MIIGRIEGQEASPRDFHKYFSHNKWDESRRDYFSSGDSEAFFSAEGDFHFVGQNEYTPEEGTPVVGYRVFTYMEGEENVLGSPVAGYMTHMDTMFGVPQRRDSVNQHPEGRGYYYFLNKEEAAAMTEYMLRDVESRTYCPVHNDAPLHIMVSRVEGTYVNKYQREGRRGQYGEQMDNMKTVDVPILDINVTKMHEAYMSTMRIKEVTEGTGYYAETYTEEVGPRALTITERNILKYDNAFELLSTVTENRRQEKHPAILLARISSNLYRDDLSFGHYDISPYKDLFSPDKEKRAAAKEHLRKEVQELSELYPGIWLPTSF